MTNTERQQRFRKRFAAERSINNLTKLAEQTLQLATDDPAAVLPIIARLERLTAKLNDLSKPKLRVVRKR
jgi:hypothetical protein